MLSHFHTSSSIHLRQPAYFSLLHIVQELFPSPARPRAPHTPSRAMNGHSVHRTLGKGGNKLQKSPRTGYNDPFTLSRQDYFTSTPSSSSFPRLKNKYIRERSRGNDPLVLLCRNATASLSAVLLLQPEPAPRSLLLLLTGRFLQGNVFPPSHTLSRPGVLPVELSWKLLPVPRSAGYLQATGRAEAGREWKELGRPQPCPASMDLGSRAIPTSSELSTQPSFCSLFQSQHLV